MRRLRGIARRFVRALVAVPIDGVRQLAISSSRTFNHIAHHS
jgi:hypothetical protein